MLTHHTFLLKHPLVATVIVNTRLHRVALHLHYSCINSAGMDKQTIHTPLVISYSPMSENSTYCISSFSMLWKICLSESEAHLVLHLNILQHLKVPFSKKPDLTSKEA